MKAFWIGVLTGIIMGTVACTICFGAEPHTGYFFTTMEDVQQEQKYREQTGTQTVDVYEKLSSEDMMKGIEPKVIGTKKVPVYEWRTYKWTTRRPKLGMNLRDYRVVGEYEGKKIVYVITSSLKKWKRLNKRLEYLGPSIKIVVQKAMKDSAYLPIARRLLYSTWYTGNKDENGNLISKRGNMAEWLKAGKPKLLDKWWPKVQYAGVPCPMPTQVAIGGKRSEIDGLAK